MSFRIEKRYNRSDIPRLLEINRICFSGVELPTDTEFHKMLETCDVWVAKDEGHWIKQQVDKQHDLWVDKYIDTKIVGFCIVNPFGAAPIAGAYIESVAVDPEYQDRGLGRDLLTRAIGFYVCSGEKQISLHTSVNNPAQKLYFDLGFRVYRLDKNHYVTYDGLLMRKML